MNNDQPIKTLDGVNGQLHLYANRVEIARKGALAKLTQGFFKGNKSIYFRQITGIQVKQGGKFTNGYIQFSIGGGNESQRGLMDATHDENTVMFTARQNKLVTEIKQYIENAMNAPAASAAPASSTADEIRKLKALLDESILTQEEFEAQKKRLLS